MNIKQRKIIKTLIVSPGRRYSELSRLFEPEEKFSYHIKYLLDNDYAEKQGDLYYVTKLGRNSIAEFDWDSLETVKQRPIIFLGLIVKDKDKFMLHKKLASPFQSWYRLPGFPINSGESINKLLKNYLQIHSSSFDLKYHSTHHRRFLNNKGEFLWNSMLIVFEMKFVKSLFAKCEDRKQWDWFSKDKIKSMEKKWKEVEICMVEKGNLVFYEYEVCENC
jgi:hypothetical protein